MVQTEDAVIVRMERWGLYSICSETVWFKVRMQRWDCGVYGGGMV